MSRSARGYTFPNWKSGSRAWGCLWGGAVWLMNCPRCDESLAADATVCSSCGLAISSSSAQCCPVCGADLASAVAICPHCGTSLTSPNHATPAAYEPPPEDEQSGSPTTPY